MFSPKNKVTLSLLLALCLVLSGISLPGNSLLAEATEVSEAETSEAEVAESEVSEAETSEAEVAESEVSEAETSEAETTETSVSVVEEIVVEEEVESFTTEEMIVQKSAAEVDKTVVMSDNWDDMEAGTIIDSKTVGAYGYKWSLDGAYSNVVKVVNKSDVGLGTEPNDNCIEITYNGYGGAYLAHWGEEVLVNNTQSGYIVWKMKLATDGATEGTWRFDIATKEENGTSMKGVVNRFKIDQTSFYDNANAGTKINFNTNTFHEVQLVLDRTRQVYSYIVDGETVKSNVSADTSVATSPILYGMYIINTNSKGTSGTGKIYIDDFEVYTTSTTEYLTEDWDSYAEGKIFVDDDTAEHFSWDVGDANNQGIKVVSKQSVTGSQTEGADDMCLKFSDIQTGKYAVYNMQLTDKMPIASATGGYAVIDMNIATDGTTGKVYRFGLFSTGGNIGYFKVDGTNIYENNNSGDKRSLGVKQFHQLRIVFDRKNQSYTYLLDDGILTANLTNGASHKILQYIQLYCYDEKSPISGSVYIDDVKCYTTNINPVPAAKVDISTADVKLSADSVPCSEVPTVASVKIGDVTLSPDTDYEVAAADGTVTVTGKGDYEGIATKDYTETHTADDRGYCSVSECGEIANGKVALPAKNIGLNGEIAVNFHFDFDQSVDTSRVTVKFEVDGKETEEKNFADGKEISDDANFPGKTVYRFSYGVYATEMNKNIKVTVLENGVPIYDTTYNVEQYYKDLEESDEATNAKKLAGAMMTYGKMAQAYFSIEGSDTEAPELNPLQDDEVTALKNAVEGIKQVVTGDANNDVIKVHGMSLVLYDKTTLRIGVNFGIDSETGKAYTWNDFTCSVQSKDNKDGTFADVDDIITTGNYKNVDHLNIPNINPADYSKIYQVVIKKGDDVMLTIDYSPMSYIYTAYEGTKEGTENKKVNNLITALYRYNEAAKEYGGGNN